MVDTVAGVAIQRAGFRKGRQALMFATCWWIATHALGRPPATVDEYVDWWRDKSRSQAFRDQQAFRLAFPEYSTPTELADAVGVEFGDLTKGREASTVAQLFSVPMPS
jgi:hypothetical protein